MFTIIFLMLAGMVAGYMLRKQDLSVLHTLISLLIWLLLFILGLEVGGNRQIIEGLHTIGLEAIWLTLAGTLGSVLAAKILWNWVPHQKQTNLQKEQAVFTGSPASCEGETLWGALKGSLVIVAFFILGVVCALTGIVSYDISKMDFSFYALGALMTTVGLSVGSDPQTLKNFRALSPRLVLLPVCTIVGTLAGCALLSLFLPHRSLTDCLAVGSGLGYYSLSSIFITEYRGAELGTIALLANIAREILTLLSAPLLVRWFGKLAPIAAGGATTMDTTLPVITRASGQDLVVVSIFHGFVTDFSAPFMVTLWCTL